jgi:CRISPR-associated protein Csy3
MPDSKQGNPMASVLKKLPGVLSFQRGTIVTDGLFYNIFDDGHVSPVPVIRHGIRGTQNINRTETTAGSASATAKRENVSNIQTTDSAKLDPAAVALRVRLELRFIDLAQLLFACAPGKTDKPEDIALMRSSYVDFVNRAKASPGLMEVACRYARNLANGRFLWRNRAIARNIRIDVASDGAALASFSALDIPLNTFGDYSTDEKKVAEVIAAGMRGDRSAHLAASATVDLGVQGAVEVFPSQNYLENKDKGFARPLYCVGEVPANQDQHGIRELGQAAFREQKIANALRTFDTWYSAYGERGVPIPIEPNGASLDAQEFFRNGKAESGFRLMSQLSAIDPASAEGMFMIACLIRGGVFSGSDN